MVHDAGRFLSDVFRSWWARIGVLNGIVSFAGRIFNLGPLSPFVAPAFVFAGVFCLVISLFQVYRKQEQEIRALREQLSNRREMTSILIDKLVREVSNNVAHLHEHAMLREEAWSAIQTADLKHLPREARNLASEFYADLRSWRQMLSDFDPRENAMQKRKDFREELSLKGNKLKDELLRIQKADAVS